jgi:hypothetical protein
MPVNDAYTLGEVRAEWIEIDCEKCNRRGEWSTQRLIQKHGPDMGLPGLKNILVSCQEKAISENAPCQAKYSQETRLSWSKPR